MYFAVSSVHWSVSQLDCVCLCSEEEGRRRMKALQRQLQDIRKEKEIELQVVLSAPHC